MNDLQTLIVGGGLSGLTLAHTLRTRQPQHRLLVLEKEAQTGGVIHSFTGDGVIAEPGPHGFLDNCAESRQLLKETGLEDECLRASLKDFVRYVYHNGTLKCIPQNPLKILRAPLISPGEKLRVAGEFFTRALPGEPSVAEWARHHFGPALLPYLDAALTGTWAGDIERLSIDSVMPGVRALEKEHGSIIRGLLAKMKAAKKAGGKKRGLPAMTSFPQGMEHLVTRIADELKAGEDILCNCPVTGIFAQEGRWKVQCNGRSFSADNLVLALPVNATLQLLAPLDPPPMPSIPEADLVNIAMTFPAETPIPPGFGFLIPEQEGKFILGCLFSSNMFPGRAPRGMQLVEVLVGGRRHPGRVQRPPEDLQAKAIADLQEILGFSTPPTWVKIMQGGRIPQLEEGSPALLQWQRELPRRHPGLHTCGFGWGGIGINDMIRESVRVAETILTERDGKSKVEVKPIYF